MRQEKKRRGQHLSHPRHQQNLAQKNLFHSDHNGTHEITLFPIFFGSFWMIVVAIGTSLNNGEVR
jgi:hypothetical protein